jgi:hypothetical protein
LVLHATTSRARANQATWQGTTRHTAARTELLFRDCVKGARSANMTTVPFAAHLVTPHDPALDQVVAVLDPILSALGFASGQIGASEGRGQVTFCRGLVDSTDGDASILWSTLKRRLNGA